MFFGVEKNLHLDFLLFRDRFFFSHSSYTTFFKLGWKDHRVLKGHITYRLFAIQVEIQILYFLTDSGTEFLSLPGRIEQNGATHNVTLEVHNPGLETETFKTY